MADESDLFYNPQEDSTFIKAGNLGFDIIIEKLNTWKSDINKVVSEGQIQVQSFETSISNLQVAVNWRTL